jgi:hypothetical protein
MIKEKYLSVMILSIAAFIELLTKHYTNFIISTVALSLIILLVNDRRE